MSNPITTVTSRRLLKLLASILALQAAAVLPGTATASASEPVVPCLPLQATATETLIDYNDPTMAGRLKIVEDYHFNSDVRSLRKGQSGTVAGDLDFVLRAVPNHYEALSAMGRWQALNGPPKTSDGAAERAGCYMARAIEFRPTDARLHLIYGVYLHQTKRLADAEQQYLKAESIGGGDAEVYYNLGLLMVDMGNLKRAQQYADKAYAMGYPLPGLRNKLRRASSQ